MPECICRGAWRPDASGIVMLGGSAMDLAGSADRSYRVVFVRLRRTEERHDCVTHEVIDVTAELGHSQGGLAEEPPEQGSQLLRITPFGHPGEPREVREQDCHLPAFASERIRDRR